MNKKRVFSLILFFSFLLLTILRFSPGIIAGKAVSKIGSEILGVDVSVRRVDLNIFFGNGDLSGLVIANPEGFKNDNAFELSLAHLDIEPSSLLDDVIIINEVIVDGAELSYEGLKGNNLKHLQRNAEAYTNAGGDKIEKSSEDSKKGQEGKKFFIRKFVMLNTVVKPVVSGLKANITIPKIEIHNIGSEQEGISSEVLIKKLLASISKSVEQVLVNLSSKIGKGLKGVGKSIGEAGKDAVHGIKKLFK